MVLGRMSGAMACKNPVCRASLLYCITSVAALAMQLAYVTGLPQHSIAGSLPFFFNQLCGCTDR